MHEDYLALKGEARARLRYLLALLAKDLSQHAHRVPGAVEASEDVAAILALAERNLRGRSARLRRFAPSVGFDS
jgi:hypothetical protein